MVAFIETFCLAPEGQHVGKPIKLLPFQKRFIKAIYDNKHGTRRAYLSIARKNGKTALIAGIMLAHLVGQKRSRTMIISGARSRNRAGIQLCRKNGSAFSRPVQRCQNPAVGKIADRAATQC